MQSAAGREVCLRPFSGKPLVTESVAKFTQESFVIKVHWRLTPMMRLWMMCLSSIPFEAAMRRTHKARARDWAQIAVLAILGLLVVFGRLASGGSLLDALVALVFFAAILFLAWLGQVTIQQAESAPPLTAGQKIWNAAVFVAFLSILGLLIWAWRWHPDWPIWHVGEPAKKSLTPVADEPPEAGQQDHAEEPAPMAGF